MSQPVAPNLQSVASRQDDATAARAHQSLQSQQPQNLPSIGTAVTPRIGQLSRLVLLHSPPALLGALFDDEAVARYSRVFTLLLECLYAKHVLELVPLTRMKPLSLSG